jgi:hypothetical protein
MVDHHLVLLPYTVLRGCQGSLEIASALPSQQQNRSRVLATAYPLFTLIDVRFDYSNVARLSEYWPLTGVPELSMKNVQTRSATVVANLMRK